MGIEHSVYETRYIPRNLHEKGPAWLLAQTYAADGLVLICVEEGSLIIDAATGEPAGNWSGGRENRLVAIGEYDERLKSIGKNRVFLSPPSEFDKTLRYVKEKLPSANATGFATKFKDKLADRLLKLEYRVVGMKSGAKSRSTGPDYFKRITSLAVGESENRYVLLCTRGGSSIADLKKFEMVKDWPGSLYMNLAGAMTGYERLREGNSQGTIITSGREYEDVLRHLDGWIFVIDGKNVIIEIAGNQDREAIPTELAVIAPVMPSGYIEYTPPIVDCHLTGHAGSHPKTAVTVSDNKIVPDISAKVREILNDKSFRKKLNSIDDPNSALEFLRGISIKR